MKPLTPKQQRFAEEYLKDLNATHAAIRAGYAANGADVTGCKLLGNPKVKRAINAGKLERSEETKIDAAWVLKRLAIESDADVADIYDDDGALLPLKQWPKIWRQGLVAGMDVEEIEVEGVKVGIIRKIKISDRVRRLELIGKHVSVNAFQDQVKVSGLDELADRMTRAKQRQGGGSGRD